jgi:hypothetical protein
VKLEELLPSFDTCSRFMENHIEFNKSVFIWAKFDGAEEPRIITREELLNNCEMKYLCDAPTEGEIIDILIEHGYCGVEAKYSANIHEGDNHDHDWEILAIAPKDNWLVVPQHTYSASRREALARVLLKVIESEEEKASNGK